MLERLLGSRPERWCGRFYRRADGTILTQDCPRGLQKVVRRISRIVGTALSAIMSLAWASAQGAPQEMPGPASGIHRNWSSIVLRVMDPTGALIPNARVRLLSSDGVELRSSVTNGRGQLRLAGVSSGSYILEVSMQGFKNSQKQVIAKAWAVTNIKVKLEVDGGTELLEVTAPTLGVIDVIEAPATTELQFVRYRGLPYDQLNLMRASR